ncbi:MAG: DUF4838 domain-containing protein [Armatimonadota bacterium]
MRIILAGLTLLLAVAAWSQLTLVDRGKARAVVVTAENPSPTAAYAARELVEHIERATGVSLPIVTEGNIPAQPADRVYLGDTAAARAAGIDGAELPPEVAVLRTARNTLYIVGHDGPGDPLSAANPWSGTLWGVYELLETKMGVRWLWLGELGIVVPKTKKLAIGKLDLHITPRFARRNLRPWTRENDPRIGFTAEGLKSYQQQEAIFLRRHRMGKTPDAPSTGHSFVSWWKQYGTAHPEWFGLRADGQRGPAGAPDRVPMCVSNPDFRHEIVRRFAEARKKNPQAPPILQIGENDVHAMCECPSCRAWDDPTPTAEELAAMPRYARSLYRPYSGGARYARFWQAVYEEARQVEPDVIVTAFIYSGYSAAPQADITLDPHIVLAFCPYAPHTPLPGPDEPMTPTVYQPMAGGQRSWFFPRTDEEQRWVKVQWDRWRATGATLYFRPNFLLNGYTMPHVYTRQLADEFQHYAERGMVGTDFDSLLGQWAAQGPMLYLLARLHERPEAKADDLLKEYYTAFGPAAPHVRAYFDYWEEWTAGTLPRTESLLVRYGAAQTHTYPRLAHEFFPPASFDEAEACLRQAEQAVANADASYRDRVAFVRAGFTHAKLCAHAAALFADPAGTPDARRAAIAEIAAFRRAVEGQCIANYAPLCYQEKRGWTGLPGFLDAP